MLRLSVVLFLIGIIIFVISLDDTKQNYNQFKNLNCEPISSNLSLPAAI
jgi:hypothetical protein